MNLFSFSIFLFLLLFLPAQAAQEKVNDLPSKKEAQLKDMEVMEDVEGHQEKHKITKDSKIYVEIKGLDEKSYLDNAKAYLELDEDDGSYITNPAYIRYLAKKGIDEIKTSLQPFGYYRPEVKLSFLREGIDRHVIYTVDLGPPLIIDQIHFQIIGDAQKDDDFKDLIKKNPLKIEDRLIQESYTKFKGKIKSLAVTNGYFKGKFTQSSLVLDKTLTKVAVNLVYDSGPRYRFEEPQVTQDFLNDSVFKRYKTISVGEAYSTKRIADMQRDLYNSGYVKQIDIDTKRNDEKNTVLVDFKLTRQKRKKYSLAFGFGTDTGFRLRYDYTWHWVNQYGHSFKTNIFLSQNLIDTGVEYRIPAKKAATDYYKFFVNYKDDNTRDLDSVTYSFGAGYHDKRKNMERELGLSWQQEQFSLGFDSGDVGTLTPYLHLIYKHSDDPLNTTTGLSLDGFITGASSNALSDITFFQAVGSAKFIKRVKRHKLTLRGSLGKTFVDDFHDLPPQFRFFTGGDRTIRGYAYEDIGDRDGSGDVLGGDKMYLGSVEYEYFFKPEMAVAAFVDAGDAFSDASNIKVGAGLGVHYYSPIGPIRVDVAHGFEEPGDNVRLHLTIGADL